MPKVAPVEDDSIVSKNLGRGFSFTATRITDLGASTYTLVTIMVDISGSVDGFQAELRKMLVTAVEACQKSPESDNILIRVCLFNTSGIQEIHGFLPLAKIDVANYPTLRPGGGTPLYDASYSAFTATLDYAKQLRDSDFEANGIVFIITDGEESGASNVGVSTVRQVADEAIKGEKIESLISILVGINTTHCASALTAFQRDAGITKYEPAGTATPGNLAKLAQFVSKSVSSQSQSVGTGGPSQAVVTGTITI
jgi:uncharacterized protein YegL